MRKTLYSALLIAVFIVLCTVQSALAYSYTSLNHGFSIDFPSGWEEAENEDVVVLYANADGSASVNIIVEETELSLANYVSESKASLEYLSYYELISERSRTIGELDGYELVFTWTMDNNGDPIDLKDKQVLFVEYGKGFIITCGSQASDYNSHLATFEQTLESFRLMSPEALNQLNQTLIIIGVVIVAIVVLVISMVLLRRRRQPTQRQSDSLGPEANFPPPPTPPPPSTP